MSMVRHGVHAQLEAAANEMLRVSLKGVTKYSEKADILTPWKEQDRRNREVYVEGGVPDSATRRGMFNRAWNPSRPDLNSREGVGRPARGRGMGSLAAHVMESGYDDGDE